MQKKITLIIAVLLFISCKKDGTSRFLSFIKTETSQNGEATFTYNKENKLETITQYDADRKPVTHSFTYNKDEKITSFVLGLISPSYDGINYNYNYSYTVDNIFQINRIDNGPGGAGSYTYKYAFLYKKDLVYRIDCSFSEGNYSNRQNIPLERLEFIYNGKNLSSVIRYNLSSMKKIEEYYSFQYDDKVNPYYVAFNGQQNFYVVNRSGYINGLDFINLNSMSVNNFLSVNVKYYDTSPEPIIKEGRIDYQNSYDKKGRLTSYTVTEQNPKTTNNKRTYHLTYY